MSDDVYTTLRRSKDHLSIERLHARELPNHMTEPCSLALILHSYAVTQ